MDEIVVKRCNWCSAYSIHQDKCLLRYRINVESYLIGDDWLVTKSEPLDDCPGAFNSYYEHDREAYEIERAKHE